MTSLTIEDIATRIPHRFENLLLDESNQVGETGSEFKLHILENDSLNRNIFAYELNNQMVLPTPILAEVAALACIVSSGAIKPGTFAYFAAITNFSITGNPFNAFDAINGTTEKISAKNGFHKYTFNIENSASQATGQIMAYYDTSDSEEQLATPISSIAPNLEDALGGTLLDSIAPYKYKSDTMTFIDSVYSFSSSEAIYSYTYPEDHPFTKGHFPLNPVMMGVCQWQIIEDAITDYIGRLNINCSKITFNASIIKSNKTPVCDLKNVTTSVFNSNETITASTESVKKVMFKQRVFPKDKLFIHISNINIVD